MPAGIRFRNPGCCHRHSLSPLALQQVDKAEGQIGIGAVGVGVEQLLGTAQGLRPQAGLPESVHSRQPDLGQGARDGLGLI